MPEEKIKCPQCLNLVLENDTDNCDKCEQKFCAECLTYYENEGGKGELGFCSKCERE